MVRLRCNACEVVIAQMPADRAEHVARALCWSCQPAPSGHGLPAA